MRAPQIADWGDGIAKALPPALSRGAAFLRRPKMRAKVVSVKSETDKRGQMLSHICLNSPKDGSYDLYTGPQFRNYMRWHKVVEGFNKGCEIWLDGVIVKDQRRRLVDADSFRLKEAFIKLCLISG